MHESSLMQGVLRRIEEVAGAHDDARVVAVTLRLGELLQISPEHLLQHFALAARGTVAAGATVTLERIADPTDTDAQRLVLTDIELEEREDS